MWNQIKFQNENWLTAEAKRTTNKMLQSGNDDSGQTNKQSNMATIVHFLNLIEQSMTVCDIFYGKEYISLEQK